MGLWGVSNYEGVGDSCALALLLGGARRVWIQRTIFCYFAKYFRGIVVEPVVLSQKSIFT